MPSWQYPVASHSASVVQVKVHPAVVLQDPGTQLAPTVSLTQAPRPSHVRPFARPPSHTTPLPHAAPFT